MFEGTPAEIRNVAAYFAATPGLNYQVQEGFGKWRVEVMFPWNQDGLVVPATDTIIKWELFAQHAEKELLNTNDQAGLVKTLSQGQKEAIANRLLVPPQPGTMTSVVDFSAPTVPDAAAGNAANALTVYTLMRSGATNYIMEAPTLRRTITTNLQYAIAYSIQYSRRLLSTSTVFSFEQVPNSLLFNINSLVGADASTNPLLQYGWYKYFPTVQQVALMKWQIVQEWQYGWWSIAYGAVL